MTTHTKTEPPDASPGEKSKRERKILARNSAICLSMRPRNSVTAETMESNQEVETDRGSIRFHQKS